MSAEVLDDTDLDRVSDGVGGTLGHLHEFGLGPFELGAAGLRECKSVLCTNFAALFRMARLTLPATRELVEVLGKKSSSSGSLISLISRRILLAECPISPADC